MRDGEREIELKGQADNEKNLKKSRYFESRKLKHSWPNQSMYAAEGSSTHE